MFWFDGGILRASYPSTPSQTVVQQSRENNPAFRKSFLLSCPRAPSNMASDYRSEQSRVQIHIVDLHHTVTRAQGSDIPKLRADIVAWIGRTQSLEPTLKMPTPQEENVKASRVAANSPHAVSDTMGADGARTSQPHIYTDACIGLDAGRQRAPLAQRASPAPIFMAGPNSTQQQPSRRNHPPSPAPGHPRHTTKQSSSHLYLHVRG